MNNPGPLLPAAILAILAFGCSGPNQANIQLRKELTQKKQAIDQLQFQHQADAATIAGLQAGIGTLPTLPESRLDELFTAHGLYLGLLTSGYHPDPNSPGDTMLKVYVAPIDEQGDSLKSAGDFTVEAFDLALGASNRIGLWEFPAQKSRNLFHGRGLLYEYVLDCPWQTTPTHENLTMRVTFHDLLTQRIFTIGKEVKIELPAK